MSDKIICPDCDMKVDKLTSRGICRQCYKRMMNSKEKDKLYVPLVQIKGTVEYNRVMGRRLSTLNKFPEIVCPDCGMVVDKLTKNGMCLKCNNRKTSCNYHNKPYIPLIELKGTNDYVNAMNRRKNKESVNTNNDVTKISENVETPEYLKELESKYYQEVYNDVQNAFKQNNLSQDYLKYKELDVFVETLFCLLQEDNFMVDAKVGETIFNRLKTDYEHLVEQSEWDLESRNRGFGLIKCLTNLRRPTKEVLDYLNVLEPIIDYLKNDSKFMGILSKCRILAKEKANKQENINYYVRESSIVAKEDFVAGKNKTKFKLYDCSVYCFNLHGNPNKQLFRAKGGVRAKDEADAKLRFKAFLKDKFASLSYKEEDMIIKEVDSEDDIKECL